ncbi:LysR substrate-binding domain-containing protein [Rhizobium sullae]|uniref:LysR substrate-binding domain-containing protein n=1 Tax=Rhizobium sullae TaxID=50338 RepID=UPI001FD23FA4|nr:LysR substrate-binding domain-containing protein [Rhizobium sullae]
MSATFCTPMWQATQVSHQVAKFGEELGVSLLTRTTRRLHATEEGRLFHERCVFSLREAESAYAEVSQHTPEPTGVLTLTAPLDYGPAVVAPIIAAYLAAYPQMRVDVVFDDDISDLVAERLDLSIRVGWLSDSSHRARRFGTFPSVAERIPDGLSPADAGSLPWIANGGLKNALRWTFARNRTETVTVEARPIMKTDKTPAAYACTLAGIGVAVFPDYIWKRISVPERLSRSFLNGRCRWAASMLCFRQPVSDRPRSGYFSTC